ncbi:DUF3768 domain-containing protein [Methylobacterium oxalidis]|uniref:DUF3768 domain-containing protein n=1 Tax=Methylobacterium oxalidis TaxID=944322 RepID=A0A512JCB5_9HYPH|nr:DUF3768 domain-containing protein [Methylobacterium oxalidis]GEP07614.1 hypothetical protein MOX02_56520 [Methylobacterium oxalidis]GJE33455.1 hypothetical protein LDDCCGHA_3655 [Methylobacterium oxalidis]GLS66198.1 hypothetical protein GCM10007888_45800 [Methylobacterium oxalidis]
MTDILDVGRVRALNDILRRTLCGGTLVLSAGIVALGRERQQAILSAVAAFDGFDPDNDPYGEHDFGALEAAGERVFFKIDYFDRALARGSSDPADSSVTARVLTVLLSHEY